MRKPEILAPAGNLEKLKISYFVFQGAEGGVSDVRFAHPTTALRLRSPRFRAAGGTVLNYHPLPPGIQNSRPM